MLESQLHPFLISTVAGGDQLHVPTDLRPTLHEQGVKWTSELLRAL